MKKVALSSQTGQLSFHIRLVCDTQGFHGEVRWVELPEQPADDEVADEVAFEVSVPFAALHHEGVLPVLLHRVQLLAEQHLVQGSPLNHEVGKVLVYPLQRHGEAMH